jgi:hypothetical protein
MSIDRNVPSVEMSGATQHSTSQLIPARRDSPSLWRTEGVSPLVIRPGLQDHFGIGSTISAFSANVASPALPLIVY